MLWRMFVSYLFKYFYLKAVLISIFSSSSGLSHSKFLNQRYNLIEKAKEAKIIGIIMGTFSVKTSAEKSPTIPGEVSQLFLNKFYRKVRIKILNYDWNYDLFNLVWIIYIIFLSKYNSVQILLVYLKSVLIIKYINL